MSAHTASIMSRPSIRRWAQKGPSCSRRFPEERPVKSWGRGRRVAWESGFVRTVSTTAACPLLPVPPHCECVFSFPPKVQVSQTVRGSSFYFPFTSTIYQMKNNAVKSIKTWLSWFCWYPLQQSIVCAEVSLLKLTATLTKPGTQWKHPSCCIFSNKPVCCRTASKPNKPTQKTLDKMFVRGSAQLVSQAKRLGKDC